MAITVCLTCRKAHSHGRPCPNCADAYLLKCADFPGWFFTFDIFDRSITAEREGLKLCARRRTPADAWDELVGLIRAAACEHDWLDVTLQADGPRTCICAHCGVGTITDDEIVPRYPDFAEICAMSPDELNRRTRAMYARFARQASKTGVPSIYAAMMDDPDANGDLPAPDAKEETWRDRAPLL